MYSYVIHKYNYIAITVIIYSDICCYHSLFIDCDVACYVYTCYDYGMCVCT